MDADEITRTESGAPQQGFGLLLDAARRGDGDALGQCLTFCQPYLEAICLTKWKRLVRGDMAADVIQQTLLDAYRGFAGFRGTSEPQFILWLASILNHNAGQYARREDRRSKSMRRVVSPGDNPDGNAISDEFLDDETASWKAMLDERDRQLRQAVAELPEQYQQVLSWRHWEGLSFGRIATLLGTTAAAARQLSSRAVARLRKRLKDEST